MIIKSERIYFEDGVKNGYLTIEDGIFKEFLINVEGQEFIDFGQMCIIPGIVDTHNHGTCGYGLLGETPEETNEEQIAGYLKGCASQGITGVFPTVGPEMIRKVADAASIQTDGAAILGIHSEGPWLNRTGEKGIQRGWPNVSLNLAQSMVKDGKGLLKLVALAPEIPGINEIISYFLSQGITVANAHSNCNYEEAIKAYDKGISISTHTGNVMTGLHHRDIGGLGAALLHDNVDCEIICDGMHICMEMLSIYFKLKDYSRFIMISDSSAFSGAMPGQYKGFEPDMIINATKEGFVLTDTGRLIGSSQPVLFGIKNLTKKLGIPLEIVIKMASLNACRKYGMDQTKGSIHPGKDADFAVIDDGYRVAATFVKGRKVYDRKIEGEIFNAKFYEAMKL